MRLVLRGASLLAAVAAAVVFAVAAPASAHNPPPVPVPADGATLDAVPTEVRLEYGDAVLELGTTVRVTGPSGEVVSEGAAVVEERSVSQAISDAGPGAYEVAWRVTSADGHPVDGSSSFVVEAAELSSPAEPSPTEPSPTESDEPTTVAAPTTPDVPASATTSSASTAAAGSTGALPFVVAGGVVVLVGIVLSIVAVRRRRARD
ncbi:copper resistance CopC family protein [Sanguibacter sp. A247]|uniref:copper resistance CopC family protein n=1 Tax=unclassified Sanguibacter TaxID=2645534 RepID=UPI003FD84065